MMEVLRNRSGDDFNSLDFLHGFFRRRADPLEAVLCRRRREKNQSSHKQKLTDLGLWSAICNRHPPSPARSLSMLSTASGTSLSAPRSTAPASQVGSFHQYHTTKGEHFLLQGCGAAPCTPLCPPPQSTEVRLPFSYFAKQRGDRSVHPRHPAPSESRTQALRLPTLPAKACRQQHFKARPAPRRNRVMACTPLWSKIWVMLGAAQQCTEKPASSQATGRIQ